MKITVTYDDGTNGEHEVDSDSYLTIEGPARNAEGSRVGRWTQTFRFSKDHGAKITRVVSSNG